MENRLIDSSSNLLEFFFFNIEYVIQTDGAFRWICNYRIQSGFSSVSHRLKKWTIQFRSTCNLRSAGLVTQFFWFDWISYDGFFDFGNFCFELFQLLMEWMEKKTITVTVGSMNDHVSIRCDPIQIIKWPHFIFNVNTPTKWWCLFIDHKQDSCHSDIECLIMS